MWVHQGTTHLQVSLTKCPSIPGVSGLPPRPHIFKPLQPWELTSPTELSPPADSG